MDADVDVIWLIRRLWTRRLPMLVVFLSVLLSGIFFFSRQPPEYRASTQIMVSDPLAYSKLGVGRCRELGLTQVRRMALGEHAAALSDSAWAAEVLASEIDSGNIERIARSVRCVVLEDKGAEGALLSLSVTADTPRAAADSANVLADTYVSHSSAWPEEQLKSALDMVKARRSELEKEIAQQKEQLLVEATQETGDVGDRQAAARAVIVAEIVAADALASKARADMAHLQGQIEAVLRPYMVSSEKATVIADSLTHSALPSEIELSIRKAANVRAAEVLSSTGTGSLTDAVDLTGGDSTREAIPKAVLATALTNRMAEIADGMIQIGDQAGTLSELWLAVRTAAARADAYRQIRIDLLRQNLPDLVGAGRTGEAIRQIQALTADLALIVESETLFDAELTGKSAPAALVVSLPAVPPTRPLLRRARTTDACSRPGSTGRAARAS